MSEDDGIFPIGRPHPPLPWRPYEPGGPIRWAEPPSDPKLAKLMADLERAAAAERAVLARLPKDGRFFLRPDLLIAALIHQAARRLLAAEVLRYLERRP